MTIMSTVFTNRSGDDQVYARDGIMWAFIAIVPFMWACVVLSTFVGNVWITKGDGGHEIVRGIYFWSLVGGKTQTRERVTRGDGLDSTSPA